MKKLIPIVAEGYTKDFFYIDITDDMQLDIVPKLEAEPYHTATIAIQLEDEGLLGLGIQKGAYLLFSKQADTYRNQVLLIRQEGKYIIRIGSHIDPMQATLTTSNDIYSPLELNAENIRIVGVMNGFINPYDDIKIVVNNSARELEELYH